MSGGPASKREILSPGRTVPAIWQQSAATYLASCRPRGRKELDGTERLSRTELIWPQIAEVQAKGKISASPDACIFPCISVSHSVLCELCDPMDWGPPGSSVQARTRTLGWVAVSFCSPRHWKH